MNILRTPADRARLIEQLMEMPLPVEVEVKPFQPGDKSHERRWYWWDLTIISDQVIVDGRKRRKEVWHEYYKTKFLPIVDQFTVNGQTRFVYKSTEDLSIRERRDYRYQVEADAIQELGVVFPERDYDMWEAI